MTVPTKPVYAAALDAYWEAGWRGVLPLPAGQKKHPPTGYTGREALTPSYADAYDWAEQRPDSNICLRLPADVIGIDVDHYDGKDGGGTLEALVAKYGPLPPTWTTGSRDDGVSGIRLFRVPEGLRWPGDLGGGIEVIQARHRYAIVWPSIHPKTGRTYVWTAPPGVVPGDLLPMVDMLPHLPQAWVDGLTGGLAEQNIQAADLDNAQAYGWLKQYGAGSECRFVEAAASGYVNELGGGSRSRHEIAKDATMRLAHLAAEGHRGAHAGLSRIRSAFLAAMAGDSRESEAPAEWDRLATGALRIAAMDTVEDADPCDNPLHGLVEHAPASPAHLLGPTPAAPQQGAQARTEAPVEDYAGEGLDGLMADASAPSIQPDPGTVPPLPSWSPVDLSMYLDGTYQPEQPTILTRTDGVSLLYPGLVHDIHGESESGKSLVAQAVTAGLIQDGQQVVYLDFESGPGPIAQRMLALGCTPEQITDLFVYVRPELNPYALTETEAFKQILALRPALVVLDGVTDALVQFGAGSDSNDEITKWHRFVPRTIADRTGAALVLIDHVVKSSDARGRFAIGGQAKLATIDGASYAAEITEPIGKGMKGMVVLRVGKDRPGTVRPHCGTWRASDRSQEAVRVVIDSTVDPNRIHWTFLPPETSVDDPAEPERVRRHMPYGAMERASKLIESQPGQRYRRADVVASLQARYGTKAAILKQAVTVLLEDGYLIADGAWLVHDHPYLQPGDPGLEGLITPAVETVDASYGRSTGQSTMI